MASSYGHLTLKVRAIQGPAGARAAPLNKAYESAGVAQIPQIGPSTAYGQHKAPRPRSNFRPKQRPSVTRAQATASINRIDTAPYQQPTFTGKPGPQTVTSHRYQQNTISNLEHSVLSLSVSQNPSGLPQAQELSNSNAIAQGSQTPAVAHRPSAQRSLDPRDPSPAHDELAAYESALSAAIQQDQQVLRGIHKNWVEVNKRIMERANLLQTLQAPVESHGAKKALASLDQATLDSQDAGKGEEVTMRARRAQAGSLMADGYYRAAPDKDFNTISSIHPHEMSELIAAKEHEADTLETLLPRQEASVLETMAAAHSNLLAAPMVLQKPSHMATTLNNLGGSPDPKSRMRNDIKKVAQLYRQGLPNTSSHTAGQTGPPSISLSKSQKHGRGKQAAAGAGGPGMALIAASKRSGPSEAYSRKRTVEPQMRANYRHGYATGPGMGVAVSQNLLNRGAGAAIVLGPEFGKQEHPLHLKQKNQHPGGAGSNQRSLQGSRTKASRVVPAQGVTGGGKGPQRGLHSSQHSPGASSRRAVGRGAYQEALKAATREYQAFSTAQPTGMGHPQKMSHNTINVGGRRGISKSTMRAHVRNTNEHTMSQTVSPVKTGASQSVGKSRPPPITNNNTSAGASSNSKTRRNVATSILHKVQLKKTIQYGTYQSSINNMQMSLLNSHNWNQTQGPDPTLSTSVQHHTNADESALVLTHSPKAAYDPKQIVIQEFNGENEHGDDVASVGPEKRGEGGNISILQRQAPLQKSTKHEQLKRAYHQTTASQGSRAISVPPATRQQSQRRGNLAVNSQVQNKLNQRATSFSSGKLTAGQGGMAASCSQHRVKSQKRGSNLQAHGAPQANAQVLVQSGSIRPAGQRPSAKQGSLYRKFLPTKSQKLKDSSGPLNVKHSGQILKQRGTLAEIGEVSRSKYHDQNILLGLGMSSQGMSEEVRQVGKAGQPGGHGLASGAVMRSLEDQIINDTNFGTDIDARELQQRRLENQSETPEIQMQTMSEEPRQNKKIYENQGIISNQFSFENGNMSVYSGSQNPQHQASAQIKPVRTHAKAPSRDELGGPLDARNFTSLNQQEIEANLQYFQSCDENLLQGLQKPLETPGKNVLGGAQHHDRYGAQSQEEEAAHQASSSLPLKVTQVLNHLSQNLGEQKLFDSEGAGLQAQACSAESDVGQNTMDGRGKRVDAGLSPLDLNPRLPELYQQNSECYQAGYGEMNESELILKKMYNQQSNRGNKILISQIIENSKNPNLMSINDAILYQNRLVNFNANLNQLETANQNRRGHNETINSSNLVMNQRDRQNIYDFLSANRSSGGLAGLDMESATEPAENQHMPRVHQHAGSSKKDAQGQGELRLSDEADRDRKDMLAQAAQANSGQKHCLNASYLKAAAGNPLLNDSINRSQLSEAVFVSAISPEIAESASQELAAQRAQRAPIGVQGGSETNQREKLNQRYQEECEEMMVVNEGQTEGLSDDGSYGGQGEPRQRKHTEPMEDGVDEEEEMVGAIVSSEHNGTSPNILKKQDNSLIFGYSKPPRSVGGANLVGDGPHQQSKPNQDTEPSNAIKNLIPFNADDEPPEEAEGRVCDLPENASPEPAARMSEASKAEKDEFGLQVREVKETERPYQRPQFVRKRHLPKKMEDNSSSERGVQSNDPTVESGHKNIILSTNSTGIGIDKNRTNKIDNLDNSKTTVSSLNTFHASHNPNVLANVNTRKSAFLFGSSKGTIIPQNNLRYSQQQSTGVQPGQARKVQLKSVALNLNKLNETGGGSAAPYGGVAQAGSRPVPMRGGNYIKSTIDEPAVVQEADEHDLPAKVRDSNKEESGDAAQPLVQGHETKSLHANASQNVRIHSAKNFNSAKDAQTEQAVLGGLADNSRLSRSRAGKLIVSDQITEQYAEEQDHTSTSHAQSHQEAQSKRTSRKSVSNLAGGETGGQSGRAGPTGQTLRSGQSGHTGQMAAERYQTNHNDEDMDEIQLRTSQSIQDDVNFDAESVKICVSPPTLARVRSSVKQSLVQSRTQFAQKMELIKSVAESENMGSVQNPSGNEGSARQKRTERSAHVQESGEIEDLHQRIFRKLEQAPERFPRRAPLGDKATAAQQEQVDTHKFSPQIREVKAPSQRSIVDDVLIESLGDFSSAQLPPLPKPSPGPNEYTRQFQNNYLQSNASQSKTALRDSRQSRRMTGTETSVVLNEVLEDSADVVAQIEQKVNRTRDQANTPALGQAEKITEAPAGFHEQWPDMGKYELSGSLTKRTPGGGRARGSPVHSDDEVTPRRGLEESMSEGKLRQLHEELDQYDQAFQESKNVAMNIKSQKLNATQNNTTAFDMLSDLNERDMDASIIIQGAEHDEMADARPEDAGQPVIKRNPGAHPLTTPRLFAGLDGTAARAQGRGAKDDASPSEDNSSACNLIESSRTGQSHRALDSHRGNQRYHDDSRTTPHMAEDFSMLDGRKLMPADFITSQLDASLQVIKLPEPQQKAKLNKRDLQSIEDWSR